MHDSVAGVHFTLYCTSETSAIKERLHNAVQDVIEYIFRENKILKYDSYENVADYVS